MLAAAMLTVVHAGCAGAQTPESAAPGTVSVHAAAHRRIPNAFAEVSLGIEVHGRDVAAVLGPLAERASTLAAYLHGEKVEQLRSDQVSVTPDVQSAPNQPDRITGYTGRQAMSFRTDPARLATLAGDALAHGANILQQLALVPGETVVETARRALAVEATRQAVAEANAVAEAAGARVTSLEQIVVNPGAMPGPIRPMGLMRAQAAPEMTVEAGETEISVQVDVRARIAAKPGD